jgi:hypothetical protein
VASGYLHVVELGAENRTSGIADRGFDPFEPHHRHVARALAAINSSLSADAAGSHTTTS